MHTVSSFQCHCDMQYTFFPARSTIHDNIKKKKGLQPSHGSELVCPLYRPFYCRPLLRLGWRLVFRWGQHLSGLYSTCRYGTRTGTLWVQFWRGGRAREQRVCNRHLIELGRKTKSNKREATCQMKLQEGIGAFVEIHLRVCLPRTKCVNLHSTVMCPTRNWKIK